MSDKFRLWMNAVEDDLLEEAMMPVKRRSIVPWISAAVAACLLLLIGFHGAPASAPAVTAAELSAMGFDMNLPEEAEQIRYEVVALEDQKAAQASFRIRDTEYVYQAVSVQEQKLLSDSTDGQLLAWNAGDLDMQLLSSSSSTSVSWYTPEKHTQYYLTANADALEVLTTASQILLSTGLDLTVAPENADCVTYNVFLLNGLTVAETTFRINGITYAYRMAGTLELSEDFADISGMEDSFYTTEPCQVRWCSGKVSFEPDGEGKILWFDVVPGILYSLSMDGGASREILLDMATQVFEPAQEIG